CNIEISSTKHTIAAPGHSPASAIKENIKEAVGCAFDGKYDSVVYCTYCKAEISRTTHPFAAASHIPASAVRENFKNSTCTDKGSYDSVIYCQVCKTEISRNVEKIAATGHTWSTAFSIDTTAHWNACVNCSAVNGYTVHTYDNNCDIDCNICSAARATNDHSFGEWVTKTEAMVGKTGLRERKCSSCGETQTEVLPAIEPDITATETTQPEYVETEGINTEAINTEKVNTEKAEESVLLDTDAPDAPPASQQSSVNVGCSSYISGMYAVVIILLIAVLIIKKFYYAESIN
ncbi:MAG: hypothetical protein II319_00575, partial [Clostridia bacterium]|nr:hypothetical protein [Clostridia bacterium]